MLYQCLGPLVCNDIADCLLTLGCQLACDGWLARDGCAHPCKYAQCIHKSQYALTPLPTLLPSSPPWPREGGAKRGRARSVCASQVAPLMMPCPSCKCCSWRCLHPFLSLELQPLYLVKALCAACPASSPQHVIVGT